MAVRMVVEETKYGGRLKYFRSENTGAEHWDSLWDTQVPTLDYSARQKGVMPRHLESVFRRWAPASGRVLEAGCGLAGFTVAANALGYDAEGVDYAPRVISLLQERFPNMKFWQGDVGAMNDVPNDTYDVVYSPGVCEHYEDGPEVILQESIRVTRPGGVLIVSAPCFNQFRRILARLGAFKDDGGNGYFYQYAFSPRELSGVLESLGCDMLEVRQYGTLKTLYDHLPFVPRLSDETLQRISNNALGSKSSRKARVLDAMPIVRNWGHSGVWVARKRQVVT